MFFNSFNKPLHLIFFYIYIYIYYKCLLECIYESKYENSIIKNKNKKVEEWKNEVI